MPVAHFLEDTCLSDEIPLSGGWRVHPIPLDLKLNPSSLDDENSIAIPDACHLQPALFPDNPYWGEQVRSLNDQAWVYRRTFEVPATARERLRLRFDGVDYFASVWVNGIHVGDHEGHFAPFIFDITGAVERGATNDLTVRVSAPWDVPNPGGVYPSNHIVRGLVKGLYEHGEGLIPPDVNPIGVWGAVWLLADTGISLDQLAIRADHEGRLQLRIAVANRSGETCAGQLELKVVAENHDGDGLVVSLPLRLKPGMQQFHHELHLPDPRLWWSWDHGFPHLYRLEATLRDNCRRALSRRDEVFGFRTVRLERTPERFTYRINGRPVFIRGTSYLPDLYLSRCTRSSLERDVMLAREANLNLIRVHVHVSPKDLYDLCNRHGMLVWQDFELNWVHDPSDQFMARARSLQREMMDLLGNHPSIITWSCHNEPTMVFSERKNMEKAPDPQLYADAVQHDPTRPVFLCSGQSHDDWQRSGDTHTYYGAIWTGRLTDIYGHRYRLNTEYGMEAPAAPDTLRSQPGVWKALRHLEASSEALWAYQHALIQYQTEYLRRLRASGCGGYIHFWLADLMPQVGFGVLDSNRCPKGGYEALRRASRPLQVMLEHDGRRPVALWVLNDTPSGCDHATLRWRVYDDTDALLASGELPLAIAANAAQRLAAARWKVTPQACARVELDLLDQSGEILAQNGYRQPFQPPTRPRGYPWKFDRRLGMKVFDDPQADSLASMTGNPRLQWLPLAFRERATEWILRQQLPGWLVSQVAALGDRLLR